MSVIDRLMRAIQSVTWPAASYESKVAFLRHAFEADSSLITEAVGPFLNRAPDLDSMPVDFDASKDHSFESWSGLFSSNSLNHGVISMTFRDAAFLYTLVKRERPKRIIEIGRYKGGSTVLIASAMAADAEFWSLDIGEKEQRLSVGERRYDDQIRDVLAKIGKKVHLMVGDSRTIPSPCEDPDLVWIDGDHSYGGAKSDFERFGRTVRVGGFVVFDDAFGKFLAPRHEEVHRVVQEILALNDFKLVKEVDRLACLQRLS